MVSTSIIYINYSDDKHAEIFLNNIDRFSYHTDIYDELEIALARDICVLISTEAGFITHFGIGMKAGKVAAKKRRFKLSPVVKAQKSINIEDIIKKGTSKIANYWQSIKTTAHIAKIDLRVWNDFILYLRDNDKENFAVLEKLFDRSYPCIKESERYRENAGFEADAFTLAMKIAGFDSYLKQTEVDKYKNNGSNNLIANLDRIIAREDLMIIHDSEIIQGMDIDSKNMISTSLSDGKNRITILYANRMPLEETLGVDLIYVDENNKVILLVQYKRLIGANTKCYYPSSDVNFLKEMETINEIQSFLAKQISTGYRFNNDAFYFKFCKDIQPIQNRDLVDGMYLPLSYFNELITKGQLRGERGGVKVCYENVPSYFNNSLFISLLKTGLIGTNIEGYNLINKVINEVIKTGKSVIFAEYAKFTQHPIR